MTEQIINVVFNVHGRVQVDLARAVEDPWWDQCSVGLDLNDKEQFQLAVRNYVSCYLRADSLLDNVPFSCGPADIYSVQIEVKSGGNTSSTDASSGI